MMINKETTYLLTYLFGMASVQCIGIASCVVKREWRSSSSYAVRSATLSHEFIPFVLRSRGPRHPAAAIGRIKLALLTCLVRRMSSWRACSLACCCGTCNKRPTQLQLHNIHLMHTDNLTCTIRYDTIRYDRRD